MEFSTFTLPNGLRCIYQSRSSSTIHVGLLVKAGSRDESPDKEGLAHFIEHALFKGTKKRKAYHILNRLDTVGAELNAYTTKEETCLHASSLVQDFSRSLELICDLAFNPVFPEKELEKEKDVINEEIQSNLDNPFELIFDEFESLLFKKHPLGGNILGNYKSVAAFSKKDVQKFRQQYYQTGQMVLSVVGGLSPLRIENTVRKYFSNLDGSTIKTYRKPPKPLMPFKIRRSRGTHQAHIILGGYAYPNSHPKKTGLILLSNILGGPTMNNRLSMSLREKKGLAYHTESNYSPYSDTGVQMIYIGTEKKHIEKAIALAERELLNLIDKPLGILQLSMAKKQLKGQIALAQENGANVMLSLGKSLLLNGKVNRLDDVFNAIDAVSAQQIQSIAQEIYHPGQLSTLIYA